MNFMIEFRAPRFEHAIKLKRKEIGIAHLDEAREDTGVKHLHPDLMYDGINEVFRRSLRIEVDESFARESGNFKDRNYLVVDVPKGFLNRFFYESLHFERDDETGEIKKAYFKYCIDEETLLEAWKDAGFPTQWGFEQQDENK